MWQVEITYLKVITKPKTVQLKTVFGYIYRASDMSEVNFNDFEHIDKDSNPSYDMKS